ncbi:MAG: LTA synthase family protein [Bacteroidetes bacterium]|nr:MAG: LTA synthase family protein [Bacteroidota bacterium]MBL1144612.1 LTA synthase family protein [Bacteroidota bacterium]NOG57407.1 LTA synthase family protein [Bacteroidota bacterium]
MNFKLPNYLKYLFKVYFIGIGIFFLLRCVSFFLNWNLVQAIPEDIRSASLLHSFLLGIRFDTIISTYLLALPFLLLFINDLFFDNKKPLITLTKHLVLVLYLIAFIIAVIDIPYFNHFNYRLTTAALMWVESPVFVVKMVVQEYSYWIFIALLIVLVYTFAKGMKRLSNASFTKNQTINKGLKSLFFLVTAFLLFIGLRGRTDFDKSPLGPPDAYFSDYSITNQMSLNPVFTFLKSALDYKKRHNGDIGLMNDEQAITLSQQFLNREGNEYSPIAKEVIPDSSYPNQPNVVLVMMEGHSAKMMAVNGNEDGCSPFLDSLLKESLYFKHIYSAGIHTHNGILGILNAYPALFERHALKQLPIQRFNNLPRVLKNHGYNNIYFSNHDLEFDNVGGFLTENGFEQLISDRIYPKEKQLSTLGVPDDYMFEFSIPYLNELEKKNKPFLATYMTTSNHIPYHFPENYKRRYESRQLDAFAYADWSLKKFMQMAQKQSWYENTIFVFVADHGWAINPTYDLALSHSHIPLIFYSPKYIPEPKLDTNMGGQIDVFPTLMGLLKLPYVNNTLGLDLLKEHRPYIYFNSDNKIGVIDQKHLYIYRKDGPESFHEYFNSENIIDSFKAKADSMRNYAFAQMQVANYLIRNNKVGKED